MQKKLTKLKELRKLKRLSLKGKIMLISSLIMMLSITSISSIFYSKIYNQTATLLEQQALGIAKAVVGGIDGNQFERLAQSLDEQDEYYQTLLNQLTEINNEIGAGMLYTIIDAEEIDYTYVVDGSGTVDIGTKQQKADFSDEAALAFKNGKAYTCEPYYVKTFDKYYISALAPIFNSHGSVVGIVEYDYEGDELSSQLRDVERAIFFICIILAIIALGINFVFLRRAFKPMGELVHSITEIATGNLNIDIDTTKHDEIGEINIALEQTVSSMRSMMHEIKQTATQVTDTAENIAASASQVAIAYSDLATSASSISEMTQKHTIETGKVKEVLEELDAQAKEISNQINETSKIANKTYDDTKSGENVIKLNQAQIESIEESILNAQELINGFMSHMSKIQGIISTISGISEQTNLLALNASIEAARAGENGKGFAVVAGEVGKLAEESNDATNEITQIIEYINGQVNQVLEAINTSVGMTEQGKQCMQQAQDVFELIKYSNKNLEKQMHEIEHEVTAISQNVSSINKNMDEIGQVSRNIDENTVNLAAITQQQMATSQEFSGMSQVLSEEAHKLNESIKQFKTDNE